MPMGPKFHICIDNQVPDRRNVMKMIYWINSLLHSVTKERIHIFPKCLTFLIKIQVLWAENMKKNIIIITKIDIKP